MSSQAPTRRHGVRIQGTVQGVGFRPFVYRLAVELGLSGHVSNDTNGVWCEVQGTDAQLGAFARRVRAEAPPLAAISSLVVSELDVHPTKSPAERFTVQTADTGGSGAPTEPALIPPDVAPCSACLGEVADGTDRRHRYAFTCCTDCGPRFTVVDSLPYDRASTSLSPFPLCELCAMEYQQPADRRFHAQATCCPVCGPELTFTPNPRSDGGAATGDEALDSAIEMLESGGILAVKGLGGFQLLCRADDSTIVQRLRDRKQRDEKPFAVLVDGIASANEVAQLDPVGERALIGPEAPILLARGDPANLLAPEVAPGSDLVGIMIGASPLHVMLATGVGAPLICTSGNLSGAPIITDDVEALRVLSPIADGWLTHDRRIARRADDSVGQVVDGRFQLLRRARGFAPRPVFLHDDGPTILGVGAELKNTVCLATGKHATSSVHLGDLENPATLRAFEAAIADQLTMSQSSPDLVVHDLHPEYLSTKFAVAQDLAPTLGVQHHHAHLVSCLVDNGFSGPAIGVIFDGLGWGTDGSAWGGEFLVGDAAGFDRAAHLRQVALPGGAAAIREPWRMAVAHLDAAFGADLPRLGLVDRHPDVGAVVAVCARPDTIKTSSIGRLFDAVASLCGVRDVVSYEGQAAIGLEQLAAKDQQPYPWPVAGGSSIDASPLVRAVVDDLVSGIPGAIVSGRFHSSVAAMVTATCRRLREETGLTTVALSGGVFQNRLLVELIVPLLEAERFDVLRHSQVPPNDGGISLGQVAIGRAYLRNS